MLARGGVDIPSTQSFFNYLLLSLFVFPLIRQQGFEGFKATIKDKWWIYIFLAACDVEANYIVVLAYQFTTLSSVMLLDCFSIPCVMVLGKIFLKHHFKLWQIVGVVLCVLGVLALVLSDWLQGSFGGGSASNPVLGDVLCLAGAFLYAVSNTGQESQVKERSKIEYLALLGLFATPISAAQSAILEHNNWLQTNWSPLNIGMLIVFSLCLLGTYCLVPIMLEKAGATYLNLSLLSSDVFAIVAGIFLFNYIPSLLYILAAALIIIGLIVFNINWSLISKDEEEAKDAVDVEKMERSEKNINEDVEILIHEQEGSG